VKKKVLLSFLALTVAIAFSLPVLARDTVTGRIQALDKVAKKITISGIEYSLSGEAAQTKFKIGDDVEATVEGNEVRSLARLLQ